MEVSIFLLIAPKPVAQGFFFKNFVCGGGPDAQGVDQRATTSWVSKPSLMRAFTLPVGVLHISTVL